MSPSGLLLLLISTMFCHAASQLEDGKTCDRPDIKHGSLYSRYYYFPIDIGKYIDYQCDINYLSHSRDWRGRITCTKLGWDLEPKCSRECPYWQAYFPNAELINLQRAYVEGDKVKFQCNYGYKTSDGKSDGERTCLPNGEFTPAKCSKTCPAPQLQNGKFSSNKNIFEIGESLLYECNMGFMTKDRKLTSRTSCGNDGWSEMPNCEPVTCIYDGVSYNNGEVVKYKCPPGQKPESEFGQCYYYGWGPPPNCQDIQCTIPATPGLILSPNKKSYQINERVSFLCEPNLERYGAPSSTCTNEDWDPPLPTCKRMCNSPELPGGKISPIKNHFEIGESLVYECNKGYMTESRSLFGTAECLREGWSETPRCIPVTCKYNRVSYKDGDIIEYKCPPGQKPESESGQCYYYGLGPPPDCQDNNPDQSEAADPPQGGNEEEEKRKKCPPAYYPINAEITNPKEAYYNNDRVTMTCVRGYKMLGSPTIQCIAGKWEQPPECIQSTPCGNPPSIHNGDQTESSIRETYITADAVTYSCKPGFHLTGADRTVCLNGKWTTLPACTENSCDEPPEVANAALVGEKKTFLHGKRAKYECKNGFSFSEEDSASCIKGQWVNIPTCVSTSCTPSPPVPNSKIVEPIKAVYESGEKVTYVCSAGYSLDRSSTGEALCEKTRWKNVPVCRRIGAQCGPPPTVQHGDTLSLTQPSYNSSDSVEYKCPDYYILKGNKIVTCLNGAWDEAPVCLEPCTAKEKDMEENNIQLKSGNKKIYVAHGGILEFNCISGHEAPPGIQMRSVCEQGKLQYPECFRKGFCILDQSTMTVNNIRYNVNAVVENGQRLKFQCNEGKIPENTLDTKCERSKINYPKCISPK